MYEVLERDWKLFRKRIPDWQEAYMDRLCKEYMEILTSDDLSSDKFWALEERIYKDRKASGVIIEMRRSRMHQNIIGLLSEGAITIADLEGFSEDLVEQMKYLMGCE